MDYFSLDGAWWLLASPDHRVPGTLTFSADGLTLVVYGSLVRSVSAPDVVFQQTAPDWVVTPLILGRSNSGKKITLLDAGGANLIGPRVTQSTYRVRLALTEVEVTEDAFTEVLCEFDCLTAWTEPPPIAESIGESTTNFRLRYEQAELGTAQIGDAEVQQLVATVVGSVGGNVVKAEQEAAFLIKLPRSCSREILNRWVRPLQDLLILALGRTVRLTGLYMKPEGAGPREPFGRVSFEAVQPSAGPTPDWSAIMSYTAPTLLTFRDSPIPFAELVPRWFQLRRNY